MPPYVTPYIPEFITVHLGAPNQGAENVTVSFPDYIKNVASSEIYPTWEPAALRANVLAQISFALNRVYTEYYTSRGYPFQITSTTSMDQKFIKGRNIFENIDELVDDIFDNYLRRQGTVEPLAAKFCNGTTTTCDGLSQWGSQDLAKQGVDSMDILRRYYGNDIELVVDAPLQEIQFSYPGRALRAGDSGPTIQILQTSLNRVSRNYPAIPKITPVDGVFGPGTERAVKRFQEIFNLTPDGVVGRTTWYKLVALYVGITRLAELNSEGQRFYGSSLQAPGRLELGDTGNGVLIVQYLLSVLSQFNSSIPFAALDGIYGPSTREAVLAFQRQRSLPPTGAVDQLTWDALTRTYEGIDRTVLSEEVLFPTALRGLGSEATRMTQYPGRELTVGDSDMERSGN